jgi:hypothetical protein
MGQGHCLPPLNLSDLVRPNSDWLLNFVGLSSMLSLSFLRKQQHWQIIRWKYTRNLKQNFRVWGSKDPSEMMISYRNNQPPIQWLPGALSLEVKRPGYEADHWPPFSAEVNLWSYTSTLQDVFMFWCLTEQWIYLHGLVIYLKGTQSFLQNNIRKLLVVVHPPVTNIDKT